MIYSLHPYSYGDAALGLISPWVGSYPAGMKPPYLLVWWLFLLWLDTFGFLEVPGTGPLLADTSYLVLVQVLFDGFDGEGG